jgi:hypothetical protein
MFFVFMAPGFLLRQRYTEPRAPVSAVLDGFLRRTFLT